MPACVPAPARQRNRGAALIKRSRIAKSGDVKVTFTLPADTPPGPVSVVGDFNDWTPGKHVLVKRAGGVRSVAITVPPGTAMRFRYLGDNGNWFDDDDADRRDGDAGIVIA
jgi:1,4-alpha-glucan branching enzyme